MSTELFADLLIKELSGICNRCVAHAHCDIRSRSTKIIIQCEKFLPTDEEYQKLPHSTESKTGVSFDEVIGLCSNCSKAHHCKLPKDPSGVWHCTEYE